MQKGNMIPSKPVPEFGPYCGSIVQPVEDVDHEWFQALCEKSCCCLEWRPELVAWAVYHRALEII